jgi:hypothetical protein
VVSGPANEQRGKGIPPATDAGTGPPAGPDYPQGSPQMGTEPDRARREAARLLRAAARRAPREVDSATLTVAGGDTVQILCLIELLDWLEGLAVRVEAGEPL